MNWKMKKSSIKINSFLLLLTVLILNSCNTEKPKELSRVEQLPFYEDASFTPNWLDPKSDRIKDFHQIPAFSLFNQNGENITEKTFENKIYVTDFFFTTCPGICPKMTANMGVLQEAFLEDDEVLLLSHSVTPKTDSVSILKEYAEDKGVVSGKWHLVTGDLEEIYRLGRKSYFVEEDLGAEKNLTDFLHTENFVLIDKNRHIRGIYNGLNKTSVKQLINDIKLLKTE
jgi:protein SCO1/2